MANSIINKPVESTMQANPDGGYVGYVARKTYETAELQNVTQGQVSVINRNGCISIYTVNLVCTPDVPIVDLRPFIREAYAYDDNGGSKMFVDLGRLYCKEANMGNRILSFVLR